MSAKKPLLGWTKSALLAVMVCSIALGAWYVWRPTAAESRRSGQVNVGGSATPSPAEELIYNLEYACDSEADIAPLLGAEDSDGREPPHILTTKNNVKVRLTGEWSITIIDKKESNSRVHCRLRNANLTLGVNGEDPKDEAAAIVADLRKGFVAQLDPQGKVEKVWFPAETGKMSRSFARAIASATQVVRPQPDVKEHRNWTAQEQDANGSYCARYQAQCEA